MTEAAPPNAVIYARISQDRTGAGLGVDRQITECRALADRLGWHVVDVHTDNDLSAYSGKPRPGYRRLLADVRSGRARGVLAWHTDRLHRSPVELEEYISACEPLGVPTHTVQAGHLDLSTASGRMVARQLGAVARFESEHKGERVRAARQQAAAAGRWQGGVRPFGFEDDGVTIRPDEAAEIVKAADALLTGVGLRSIVRDLNARGVRTTFKAQHWAPQSFRDVLLRPRNAGIAVYRGEEVGPAEWPPILPEETWRAVVGLLTDPARRTSPAASRVKWLGSGLYLCGVCGQPRLRVSTSGGGQRPTYRCSAREAMPQTTGHVARNATHLDDYVSRIVIERLTRADAADLLTAPPTAEEDIAALRAEAIGLRHRLEQLADAHADGEVTLAQLTRATARMRSRLDAIDTAVAAAVAVAPLAGLVDAPDVAQTWQGLDVGRRRAVLDTLMTVTVLPAGPRRGPGGARFDPASVAIEWKG